METLEDVICCGKPVGIQPDNYEGVEGFGIWCNGGCGKSIFRDLRELAIKDFQSMKTPQIKTVSPKSLPTIFEQKRHDIEIMASTTVQTGAMERLMHNNTVRYPLGMTGNAWDKVWQSPQGQDSIVKGLEDAMIMGIELGKMGDLVPFGESCQLIPSIEAYEFCLTNGNNAPFIETSIECIYENDVVKSGRKDGNFFVDFNEIGIPRGQVIAVAVSGTLRDGKVIGEIYDSERLMQKAEAHSTSYQYYIRDKRQAEALRAEGKILTENGREYFNKTMNKKGGGTWNKKVYLDELSNPYDGADRPEMFRKSAGKSFFSKFIRVRNSEAVVNEIKDSKSAVNESLRMAGEVLDD